SILDCILKVAIDRDRSSSPGPTEDLRRGVLLQLEPVLHPQSTVVVGTVADGQLSSGIGRDAGRLLGGARIASLHR
ncbi:hypothetical protein PMAYCL1PPCAC_22727, partial [Pristionchus mayeri]